jgi:hypothetical protein
MGTKSIREIVESALVAHLAAQTELAGVNIERGIETDVMNLPTVVVSCEAVSNPPDLPEGLGNSADATNAKSNHRDRCAAVLGALQEVSNIKTVFTTQGDATCYDVTYQSHDDSRGDRALGMMATFTVAAVLPA